MDYKKEIIEMIEKITKTENISMLYGVVKTMVEYEDQKEKSRELNPCFLLFDKSLHEFPEKLFVFFG